MPSLIYEGRIDGEFEGFGDELLFKMRNGTYWLQAKYKYWYHYAYSPHVEITEQDGRYYLTVVGHSIPVRKIRNVIESRINGAFNGWAGDSEYELRNGQVWQQSNYKYEYKYAYMPEAIIYETGGEYKMSVAGTAANVKRVR